MFHNAHSYLLLGLSDGNKTFYILVQGFSNGALGPLWEPRSGFLGDHEQRLGR